MERLYNHWSWRIAQELPISKKEFSALTLTAKVAFIRQFPPLLLPFYKQHSKDALYHAAWSAGVSLMVVGEYFGPERRSYSLFFLSEVSKFEYVYFYLK